MLRIGVFATGRGQGSRELVQAIHDSICTKRLDASVEFVYSNRDPGEFPATDQFFDQVREFGYPLITSSFRKFKESLTEDANWRVKYDRKTMKLLESYTPDLCVLAGYLLIFGTEMCNRYQTINLHPAAPDGPVGMWQQVIWQVIDAHATQSGNMMQVVTPDLDQGPIVAYSTFPIVGNGFDDGWEMIKGRAMESLKEEFGESLPLFQCIRRAGVIRERLLVVETLRAFAQQRVGIQNQKVVNAEGVPVKALDLTEDIELMVRSSQDHR